MLLSVFQLALCLNSGKLAELLDRRRMCHNRQDKESVPEALVRLSAAGSKSLRAELSVASAELRDKAGELSQAQLALRCAHPRL